MDNWNKPAQGYVNISIDKIPEQKLQVAEQLERVFYQIEILEKAIAGLDKKISSVTLQDAIVSRTPTEDTNNLVQLAQQLSIIANRIMSASEFINSLTNRVQL